MSDIQTNPVDGVKTDMFCRFLMFCALLVVAFLGFKIFD